MCKQTYPFLNLLSLLEVSLFGVCPEKAIHYPKINSTEEDVLELSAGHTHMFMLNQEGDVTEEEEEEKRIEEEVVILGEQINKKKKKKMDKAAIKIQRAWKKKADRIK